jgi:hypothetical protein
MLTQDLLDHLCFACLARTRVRALTGRCHLSLVHFPSVRKLRLHVPLSMIIVVVVVVIIVVIVIMDVVVAITSTAG